MAIKYLVALPIPDPAQGLIADVKASLKPAEWRDTMDPHITVLAPDRPLLPEVEAGAAFTKLAAGLSGFSLRASQLKHFAHRNRRTIYLRLVPDRPLHELFNALLLKANWQETTASTKRPYHPHITLVNQLSTDLADDAEDQLHALKLDLSFTCTRVCLYAKRKAWPKWKLLAESPLVIGK